MRFRIESKHLGDIAVLAMDVFEDDRGFFTESYRADYFSALGLPSEFPQDSHSRSKKGVIRGLHFQYSPPMGKVIRVTSGAVFMVGVDIRKGSPTLGKWHGVEVSADNKKLVSFPAGFAPGFCVLSDFADVQYKCTSIYNPQGEGAIRWNDPEIGIRWPVADPIVSQKDRAAQSLSEWLASPLSDHCRY
jgi:dTDP-4-dehydrorhamnose 3,5-epimerase